MPVLKSSFKPPALLRNGHVQTILPVLLHRRFRDTFARERLELDDGDFLDLDWRRGFGDRIVILSHGLEGAADQAYIRGMAVALAADGWDSLAWTFRGCGVEPNRLVRAYHSGDTPDLATVIRRAAVDYQRIALIGFSLGGNLTLKYLGEAPPHPAIVAAAAISVPIDLAASSRKLDSQWSNRIYLRRFIKTLVTKIEAKARLFPGKLDTANIRNISTFGEFDDRFTAPMHGFRDAADYWSQSSARQFLPNLTIPTLLLNARDDPFLTPECFPFREASANPNLFLETPESGGHVGFIDLANGFQPWTERRVPEFLSHRGLGDVTNEPAK